MKAVILAGGLGTRLSEETSLRPKPMVEIGGKPILWHIMKIYSAHGINEFIICCGYKGYMIKEYFSNYRLHMSDVTFDFTKNETEIHIQNTEPWRVTLVDTGHDSMTGGRLLNVKEYLENDDDFCFTYGDGVGDINIRQSIEFHKSHGKKATLVSASPPGRFGSLNINGNLVTDFTEKPINSKSGTVNAGFFVLSTSCLDYISDNRTIWEEKPLNTLALEEELMAYNHSGFWQPMDTLRDKNHLSELWDMGNAPWKTWI